jgi:hypothetical protein
MSSAAFPDRELVAVIARASRKHWIAMAAGCGLAAWVFIGSAVLRHAGAFSVALGLLAAAGFIASARIAIRRPLRFSIQERGIELGAGKRLVRWEEIDQIQLAQHQGAYGEERNLVLKLKRGAQPAARKFVTTNATDPDEVELGLDGVEPAWQNVVRDVEAASGMKVLGVREGAFRLGSRPTDTD